MSTEPGQMALSGAKTAHARLELFAGASSLDLSADLVGERLDRGGIQTSERRASLHLVERAHKSQKLGVCERGPAIDQMELRHALTVGRSREGFPARGDGRTLGA